MHKLTWIDSERRKTARDTPVDGCGWFVLYPVDQEHAVKKSEKKVGQIQVIYEFSLENIS